jgi:hypothetical protein
MSHWVIVTVAFVDGKIMVSTGTTPGENVFMEYQDPNPITVHWVGVMTGWGAEGNWLWDVVENPQTLNWNRVNMDSCLHSKETFDKDAVCDENAVACQGEIMNDMMECCSCTCEPDQCV